MRWYLSYGGKTEGPVDRETVVVWARQGFTRPGTFVRNEAASVWVPIEQSPFAGIEQAVAPDSQSSHSQEPIPEIPMNKTIIGAILAVLGPSLGIANKRDLGRMIAGCLVLAVGFLIFVTLESSGKDATPHAPTPVATPEPDQPATVEDPNTRIGHHLWTIQNTAEAVQFLRPMFKDTTNEIDPMATLLALWAATHMSWADLQTLPEINRADVMKDPEAERGKRLCWSGSVAEIATDRSAGVPVCNGGIVNDNMDVVRFETVGSSGNIVEHSWARVCGVVTGRYSYLNAGAGVTHSVLVVGMFDLPENHRATGLPKP